MPDVEVTRDPLVVYAMVALLVAIVVVGLALASPWFFTPPPLDVDPPPRDTAPPSDLQRDL